MHETLWKWNFYDYRRNLGFTFHPAHRVVFAGGCFRIRVDSEDSGNYEPFKEERGWIYSGKQHPVQSPNNLRISLKKHVYVKLIVQNLSPETDGLFCLFYRQNGVDGYRHAIFSMAPYQTQFQEVICLWNRDLNEDIQIDHFDLYLHKLGQAGNISVKEIEIYYGDEPEPYPEIDFTKDIPLLNLPDYTQAQFKKAYETLNICVVKDYPSCGFQTGPYTGPGGGYGACWWQSDTSYVIGSMLWTDRKVAKAIVEGFMSVQSQNPDGRIDLWGNAPFRGLPGECSSIPRSVTEFGNYILTSFDREFNEKVYESVKKYTDWWFMPHKRDHITGLICGIFEESNLADCIEPRTKAQIDLNVEVAVCCKVIAELAKLMGKENDEKEYTARFEEMKTLINRYLWDEKRQCYYARMVREKDVFEDRLICSIYDTLRYGIADEDKKAKIFEILDEEHFFWDSRPLSSISRTDPTFVEAVGDYDGEAWKGDIWTARSFPVIKGFKESGEYEKESHLIHRTLQAFKNRYSEYVTPTAGTPEGVQDYAWTASHCIQIVINYLFGISVNTYTNTVTVEPCIPEEYFGKEISIRNVKLPCGGKISVRILKSQDRSDTEITFENTKFENVVVRERFANAKELQISCNGKKNTQKGNVAEYCGKIIPEMKLEVIKK